MASAKDSVLPQSGIPKTLGILNVIFGVLMILAGLCIVGVMVAWPTLSKFAEEASKQQQAPFEAQRKQELKTLEDREQTAKTDEEKKAIQSEKDAVVARTPPVPAADLGPVNQMMTNPTIKGFTLLQWGSGLVLGLILMISGIGLIRLTSWGRSLALAWASIQILQLILLVAYEAVVVSPVQMAETEKMLAKMEDDVKANRARPGMAEQIPAQRAMLKLAPVRMAAWVVFGSIYPVIVLILLNTAGAKATCLPKYRDDLRGF